ncbi:quinone oxidoreductase family protein [Sphingomonas sp. Root241]|uniref:quinone oxidoreductase family protein n=1 Tax=Sphingomonas sp. Root241 TaxID=1736501 RepID=UPI0006FAB536|nr:quinone oxidoreductase [Sphingomonas sp. Root241]KRC79174.1 quinone oxidoreductase [Sphingomonas sp. Root241]
MARAAKIETTGGPEVIGWADVELPSPGPGEVRMRNTVVGLNFIDTYFRSGLYPVPLPSGLGQEAAGVIEAVGEGVTGFAPGDRVATFGPPIGAYATERNLPASSLFRLPDTVDDETAAAALLKGCTAEFLIERCARVQPGWPVLVHAAAGGVGQILVQWLKAIGAEVIGTVGSEAKVAAARGAGADHVLLSRSDDIAARVRDITGGAGVAVVFDGVGKATWEASLAATRRRGLIVSYGNASGAVEGVQLRTLASHGSLFVSRPTSFDYYVTPEERAAGAGRLFAMLESKAVRVVIGQRFALADVAAAHAALEAGETTGSTVLLP